MSEFEFEFDQNKSGINKLKHGIDFIEVQQIFDGDNIFIQQAKTMDNEERFALIGLFESKCYAVIFTLRGNKIRIISARRCRKKEKQRISDD